MMTMMMIDDDDDDSDGDHTPTHTNNTVRADQMPYALCTSLLLSPRVSAPSLHPPDFFPDFCLRISRLL
jgi:hypothetical protein